MAIIVIVLFLLVSKKEIVREVKISPFECGFIPRENSRSRFSNQFFLIALIFLIFDVELILLFPFLASIQFIELFSFKLFWWFVVILILGIVLEWSQKALEWKKY